MHQNTKHFSLSVILHVAIYFRMQQEIVCTGTAGRRAEGACIKMIKSRLHFSPFHSSCNHLFSLSSEAQIVRAGTARHQSSTPAQNFSILSPSPYRPILLSLLGIGDRDRIHNLYLAPTTHINPELQPLLSFRPILTFSLIEGRGLLHNLCMTQAGVQINPQLLPLSSFRPTLTYSQNEGTDWIHNLCQAQITHIHPRLLSPSPVTHLSPHSMKAEIESTCAKLHVPQ